MDTVITLLMLLIGLLHFGFFWLEASAWDTPRGHKIFRMKPEQAKQTKTLALNQGYYNLMLSIGLIWSAVHPTPLVAIQLQIYLMVFVIFVGLVGWLTVSRTILYVQALPAVVALAMLLISLMGK